MDILNVPVIAGSHDLLLRIYGPGTSMFWVSAATLVSMLWTLDPTLQSIDSLHPSLAVAVSIPIAAATHLLSQLVRTASLKQPADEMDSLVWEIDQSHTICQTLIFMMPGLWAMAMARRQRKRLIVLSGTTIYCFLATFTRWLFSDKTSHDGHMGLADELPYDGALWIGAGVLVLGAHQLRVYAMMPDASLESTSEPPRQSWDFTAFCVLWSICVAGASWWFSGVPVSLIPYSHITLLDWDQFILFMMGWCGLAFKTFIILKNGTDKVDTIPTYMEK